VHPSQENADAHEPGGAPRSTLAVDADALVLKAAGADAPRLDWYTIHLAETRRDGIAVPPRRAVTCCWLGRHVPRDICGSALARHRFARESGHPDIDLLGLLEEIHQSVERNLISRGGGGAGLPRLAAASPSENTIDRSAGPLTWIKAGAVPFCESCLGQ
jgi:hypothetical protein